jgi:hypothetical protein
LLHKAAVDGGPFLAIKRIYKSWPGCCVGKAFKEGGEVHVRVALASQLYDGSGFFKK